jgi:uncharacterized cofD-like protein
VSGPRVVAVGGGHGLAATIRAATQYASHVTAVVTTADDGGSTGRLRAGMSLPAPGDLRRCLLAMAGPDAGPLADALDYRFAGTDVEGHALGNLLLAALTQVTGDFAAAAEEVARLLGVDPTRGCVLPATAEPVRLCAMRAAGGAAAGGATADTGDARLAVVSGEVAVSACPDVERVWVAPEPDDGRTPGAPAAVVEALAAADQVVLGPGSLYSSVLAAAVVDDVRTAIAKADAERVFVCNLRAEAVEAQGYDVAAHVAALVRHGVEPDVVVVQPGAMPYGEVTASGARVVEADVTRPHGLAHDADKLATVLSRLAAAAGTD